VRSSDSRAEDDQRGETDSTTLGAQSAEDTRDGLRQRVRSAIRSTLGSPFRQHPEIAAARARIRALEVFGVGEFSSAETETKYQLIHSRMCSRRHPTHPYISVVVPAHREAKYILGTLRSLAEQTYDDCEFLVVSNGEPRANSTQRIAEACGMTVLHDAVGGIARARQTGLEAARGEVVVSTDADTLHDDRWLQRISEIMQDGTVTCGAGLLRSLSKDPVSRAAQAFITWTMRAKNAMNPRLVTGVSEANSFFRRELALAAGGYDCSVRVGEGMALFRRFLAPGAPLIYTDDELVVATSGRRIDREGAARWLRLAMLNTTLQLFGRTGIQEKSYPDVR
jgi:Glycosyl transferase family 2